MQKSRQAFVKETETTVERKENTAKYQQSWLKLTLTAHTQNPREKLGPHKKGTYKRKIADRCDDIAVGTHNEVTAAGLRLCGVQ